MLQVPFDAAETSSAPSCSSPSTFRLAPDPSLPELQGRLLPLQTCKVGCPLFERKMLS